jgi:hypothetical protein
MTPIRAWRDGIRRVLSAPSLLVAVWAITTAASIPLTLAIRAQIEESLKSDVDAAAAARGIHYEWMQEFSGQAAGLATTFRPTIVGFAAVLDNLSAVADDIPRPGAVAAAAGAYALAWIFLSGGVIGRYQRDRVRSPVGFLSDCGAYFFRFLRLALVNGVVYGVLFGVLHPLLFVRLYPRLTAGAVEPAAFAVRLGFYALFVLLLAAANIVFDYARVRAVVEDRRSMLMALVASWRFIAGRPGGAIGVYLLNALLFGAGLVAYSFLAPPGGGIGVMAWAAFAIGQVYIAGRLAVRLLFFASETAIVEATLNGSPYVID